jgi:hypothetical protein
VQELCQFLDADDFIDIIRVSLTTLGRTVKDSHFRPHIFTNLLSFGTRGALYTVSSCETDQRWKLSGDMSTITQTTGGSDECCDIPKHGIDIQKTIP